MLSRRVRSVPELGAEFEAGIEGLLVRLRERSEAWALDFLARYDAFIEEFGSRSTSEYEATTQGWETHPSIPLGLLDRMRLQDDGRDPGRQSDRLRQEREALTLEVRSTLADQPEALGMFEAGMRAVSVYLPARELSKTTMVRAMHEARLPFPEIATRAIGRGQLRQVDDITMLTLAELDEFVLDPDPWLPVIAERWAWREELQCREPPFVLTDEIPPVSGWPLRTESSVTRVLPGDVLLGEGACPGVATGVARVINHPAEATELEPGEILVAPETDLAGHPCSSRRHPSWSTWGRG